MSKDFTLKNYRLIKLAGKVLFALMVIAMIILLLFPEFAMISV